MRIRRRQILVVIDGDVDLSPPSFSGLESSQNTTIVHSRGSTAVFTPSSLERVSRALPAKVSKS